MAPTATTLPHPAAPAPADAPLAVLRTAGDDWARVLAAVPGAAAGAVDLVDAAAALRPLLPPSVIGALTRPGPGSLARDGALLVRGAPVGELPATPVGARPAQRPRNPDATSELILLAVARLLGEPVGYLPEHGGDVVQDLIPSPEASHRQTSTSSAVELEFHTETAFHPHRPHHLLLLCLRGDPAARTLLCDVGAVLRDLDPEVVRVLREPRFRTRPDESFTDGRVVEPGPPAPVVRGDDARPTVVFDADLMTGTDPAAQRAIEVLDAATRAARSAVTLAAGDLLVVDNHRWIHGRSAFRARYDGTDRWLQRAFVVDDLAPSAHERTGRVITTTFA